MRNENWKKTNTDDSTQELNELCNYPNSRYIAESRMFDSLNKTADLVELSNKIKILDNNLEHTINEKSIFDLNHLLHSLLDLLNNYIEIELYTANRPVNEDVFEQVRNYFDMWSGANWGTNFVNITIQHHVFKCLEFLLVSGQHAKTTLALLTILRSHKLDQCHINEFDMRMLGDMTFETAFKYLMLKNFRRYRFKRYSTKDLILHRDNLFSIAIFIEECITLYTKQVLKMLELPRNKIERLANLEVTKNSNSKNKADQNYYKIALMNIYDFENKLILLQNGVFDQIDYAANLMDDCVQNITDE